jgi:serine/threonine-protein kinase
VDPKVKLIDVATAIADGTPIDWQSVESDTSDRIERQVASGLRLVEQLALAHSALAPPGVPTAGLPPEGLLTWGPLTIVEKIGSGAFGDVYRARDPRLDRPVALKLLHCSEHDWDDPQSVVIDEARLMARVRHPNVVTVHGAERIGNRVGIWMELIDGPTLDTELRQKGPFSTNEIVQLGRDLCGAIEAVHRAGLLHGDVKASNILRDANGRIVLGDFGAGHEFDQTQETDGSSTGLTGTPLYLAPEVLEGGRASVGSDIYSLGVLLYHLATGSFPVHGRTLRELRDAHARGVRVPLSSFRGDLPRSLIDLVERCVDRDATRRFATAADVQMRLQEVAGHRNAHRALRNWIGAATCLAALAISAFFAFRRSTGTPTPQSPAGVVQQIHPQEAVATRATVTPESEVPVDGKLSETDQFEETAAAPLRLNGGDWILVAAIDNRTGEEVLDGTIEAAIKRELEYSEHIRVAQRDRIEDALRVLGQPLDSNLDRSLARQIALRDGGLRAAVAGSVDKVAGAYVIRLDVVRPDDGRTVTSVTETLNTQDGILTAVRKQVFDVRQALGEPATTVDRSRALLASTHLPSVEAFSLYVRAAKAMNLRADVDVGRRTDWAAVEDITRRAVDKDPMFARAAIILAYALANQGRPQEEYLAYAAQAFTLADTATPQERYFIIGSFYGMQPGARGTLTSQGREQLERSVAAYEALLKLQPDHYELRNNLRNAYRSLGRDTDIAWMNLRLAEARPLSVTENLEVARRLLREGNWDGARRYAARAESALSPGWAAASSLPPGSTAEPLNRAAEARMVSAYIAWLQDDPREALKIADRVQSASRGLTGAERREVYTRLWVLYAALGRLRQAEQTIEALRGTDGANLNETLQSDLAEAQFLAMTHQPARLRELMGARALQPLGRDTPTFYAARIEYLIQAGLLEFAERDLEWFKQRGNTGTYEILHAALERARGHPDAAIAGFQRAKTLVLNPGVDGVTQQGHYAASEQAAALESVGRLPEAIETLERVPDRVLVVSANTLGRWLHGRAQLARLYRKNRQDEKAREIEAHLLTLLAMADAAHPLVQELRARSASK